MPRSTSTLSWHRSDRLVDQAGLIAPDRENRPAEFVEALAKGLMILESFDAGHAEMTLSEVARRVRLSPAAARRSLITLMELGYVGQTNRRFHLRPRVMSFSSAFYLSARIDELLQPELRQIVDRFGDASSVATLDGDDVVYVAHCSVQRARRAMAVVGARYPAHATSLGRVLLAALDDDALDAYFNRMTPVGFTSNTVTDKDELRRIVTKARSDGYAATVDQLDYGITALAVPIGRGDGKAIAALNSSGYSGHLNVDQLITERLTELRAAASRIGRTFARYPVMESIIGM